MSREPITALPYFVIIFNHFRAYDYIIDRNCKAWECNLITAKPIFYSLFIFIHHNVFFKW